MARYEVKVLPWAVTDVRETYLYLLEREDRLAEDFERRVREAILAVGDQAHSTKCEKTAFDAAARVRKVA